MVICGQKFEFSLLKANDVERLERSCKKLERWDEEEKRRVQQERCNTAEQIRGQCRIMMRFLDELLGQGAARRLGLDENDLGKAKAVFDAIELALNEEAERQANAVTFPQANRAARRKRRKNHG